jgi:beta-glucosidase/6-phospho-beta-glucosidase/beta-galactosidase
MFQSYYMAGFECATGYNARREWIDQVVATQHDELVALDYQLLSSAGILTAREAMRWPLIDRGGRYDFASVAPFVRAAEQHGIELLWDLFHYGYPADVDLFGDEFPDRFADYCRAAALYASRYLPGPYYFTPVNEASYFSWAGAEVGRFGPHQQGRGGELKLALARASLRAIAAIREVCPGARMLTVDPICHVVCPPDASDRDLEAAQRFNHEVVFEYMDMMCGKRNPELGGHHDALDIVGINYYWTNQWQLGGDTTPLASDDPRRLPLGSLVRRAFERYGNDVVITETSELGDARGG